MNDDAQKDTLKALLAPSAWLENDFSFALLFKRAIYAGRHLLAHRPAVQRQVVGTANRTLASSPKLLI